MRIYTPKISEHLINVNSCFIGERVRDRRGEREREREREPANERNVKLLIKLAMRERENVRNEGGEACCCHK